MNWTLWIVLMLPGVALFVFWPPWKDKGEVK